jgi:hypothetical protein
MDMCVLPGLLRGMGHWAKGMGRKKSILFCDIELKMSDIGISILAK